MSDLYTMLQVSPRKKRCPPELDNDNVMTPKKLRTVPPTPPPSTSHLVTASSKPALPSHLKRLYIIQTALQHALSHALATCAISPTSDSGQVKNVLNHISVSTYSGFKSSLEIDDLRRLCWLWEWDGQSLSQRLPEAKEDKDEDNPFLDSTASVDVTSSDWTRGSMGVVLSPVTHFNKAQRRRVPAYGIGIEVEMDIDKDMKSGMAAVARWTAAAENRCTEFRKKLERWQEIHDGAAPIPDIPLANLPVLSPARISAFTRSLASCSPSAATSSMKPPSSPASPSRSSAERPAPDLSVPFPKSKSIPKKSSSLFPRTPSRHDRFGSGSIPPQTPSSTSSSPSKTVSVPSTPDHLNGENSTSLQTPSTSRRQALYERVRQRSMSNSPTKIPNQAGSSEMTPRTTMTRDQLFKMQQEELRRRCLLGRLSGVAESVWMLFSVPAAGSSTPTRKRRALPAQDVISAVIKSSPVPISMSEANESISMLIKLCPFFLKRLDISGGEWLEMPAASSSGTASTKNSPSKSKGTVPLSPGRIKGKEESAQELLSRSPRRIKRETGGLREVREIIRRELELQD